MDEYMKEAIIEQLEGIERQEEVRILYACESGSRAWGFASADSDYDVRFVYLHPPEWYLSIDKQRDVIERPIHAQLDISGWDLRKALQLFRKSNPPLLEWLDSPTIYLEPYDTAQRLRKLAEVHYLPNTCAYHYLHMAQGNYREYLQGDWVWTKKYFYVLRPVLAVLWLERGLGVVPTEFAALLDGLSLDLKLRGEIEKLLIAKRAGAELDKGRRIPVISEFIEEHLARFENKVFNEDQHTVPVETLDAFFRESLANVWQKAA